MSQPMSYRRFGRTGLQMPVLTCGGMRYQHAWKDTPDAEIPHDNQANLEATILKAIDNGINHIETARGYGSSEYQLGKILPNLDRDSLIVQTKVPPKETGAAFRETFDFSMQNLRLDHVELLGIHGVNNDECLDLALAKGGSLDAARQLQREGRVRHIGFSTHGPLKTILRAIETGEFDYVNLHWYYVEQTNWAAIEAATRHDMGVFIISPNDKGGKLYEPPATLVDLCRPLTPMGFNDLFCLSHPQVHTLSIGAAKPQDFDAHLEILPLVSRARDVIDPILRRLDRAFVDTWGRFMVDNWWKGLPQWDAAPGGVNIYQILRLLLHARALDMVEYGKMRYNLLGSGGHWFPGNKIDQMDWQQLQRSVAASPIADLIPSLLREAEELLGGEEVKRLSQSAN